VRATSSAQGEAVHYLLGLSVEPEESAHGRHREKKRGRERERTVGRERGERRHGRPPSSVPSLQDVYLVRACRPVRAGERKRGGGRKRSFAKGKKRDKEKSVVAALLPITSTELRERRKKKEEGKYFRREGRRG